MIARWESGRGKDWVDLYKDEWGYGYTGPGSSGNMGNKWASDDSEAISKFESEKMRNCFRDDAKQIKRVK